MAEIQRSRLEKAERDLRSIADRHLGAFRNRDIDWRVIRDQLRRLDEAFQNGDGNVFNEALGMLVTRLSPPNALRGQIGSASGSQPMPRDVLELVNHIVDSLRSDLTRLSDKGHDDDVGIQLGTVRDRPERRK